MHKTQCTSLKDMVHLSQDIFKDDAVGRLQLITHLHNFEKISYDLQNWEEVPDGKVDIDSLLWSAFFPRLKMSFSSRENPLEIVESLKKMEMILKKEMLLFYQKVKPQESLNKKQFEVLGGFMNRSLGQLPIDTQINLQLAQSSMENMPEFLFFQKLLILQREFTEMDLKDFSSLVGDNSIPQSDSICFKIAQGIFKAIDKFQQNEHDYK